MTKKKIKTKQRKKMELPFLVLLVALSTMIACIGGSNFLGYNISGYAWVVPLVVSVFAFLSAKGRVTFPLTIWLPWIIVAELNRCAVVS